MSPRTIASAYAFSEKNVGQNLHVTASAVTPGWGTTSTTTPPHPATIIYSDEGPGYYIFPYSMSSLRYSTSLRGPWTTWNLPSALTTFGQFSYGYGCYSVSEGSTIASAKFFIATTIGGAWQTGTSSNSATSGGFRKLLYHTSTGHFAGPRNGSINYNTAASTAGWSAKNNSFNLQTGASNGTNIVWGGISGVLAGGTNPTSAPTSISTNVFGNSADVVNLVYNGSTGSKVWVAVGTGKISYTSVTAGTSGWTAITPPRSLTKYNGITFVNERWFLEGYEAGTNTIFVSSGSDIATSTWSALTIPGDTVTAVSGSTDGTHFFTMNVNSYDIVATR